MGEATGSGQEGLLSVGNPLFLDPNDCENFSSSMLTFCTYFSVYCTSTEKKKRKESYFLVLSTERI